MAWQGRGVGGWQWRKVRALVLERDRGVCHICHQLGADQVDHLTSRARGGSDDPSNLAAVHAHPCHQRKTHAERPKRPSSKRPPERHPGRLP